MLKDIIRKSIYIILLSIPTTCFAWHDYGDYGDWDYHGSGRDHPYSAYIDRRNYVGPADYISIKEGYVNSPLVFQAMPVVVLPDQFPVNIPNSQGGYNTVIIQRSGEGFKGPEGEYYPEFPKVFQLQMRYGK